MATHRRGARGVRTREAQVQEHLSNSRAHRRVISHVHLAQVAGRGLDGLEHALKHLAGAFVDLARACMRHSDWKTNGHMHCSQSNTAEQHRPTSATTQRSERNGGTAGAPLGVCRNCVMTSPSPVSECIPSGRGAGGLILAVCHESTSSSRSSWTLPCLAEAP